MFHGNLQTIVLSLLDLLKPKESTIAMCASDPDEYVDILDDFCMNQQREMLETKAISLISSLCLYIDGYMSFISSLCIMLLKEYEGSLEQLPGAVEYMKIINSIWKASSE